MTTNHELRVGRAKNAVLDFLEKSLYVPKIYINALWDGSPVDVLAIDRDGAGDVHAVMLFGSDVSSDRDTVAQRLSDAIQPLFAHFEKIPAQYKYLAAVDLTTQGAIALPGVPPDVLEESYSPDGLGRIGFLSVNFVQGTDPVVKSVLKPERFRAKVARLADEYVQQHAADWEIRA